jgi:hypothetical protein
MNDTVRQAIKGHERVVLLVDGRLVEGKVAAWRCRLYAEPTGPFREDQDELVPFTSFSVEELTSNGDVRDMIREGVASRVSALGTAPSSNAAFRCRVTVTTTALRENP